MCPGTPRGVRGLHRERVRPQPPLLVGSGFSPKGVAPLSSLFLGLLGSSRQDWAVLQSLTHGTVRGTRGNEQRLQTEGVEEITEWFGLGSTPVPKGQRGDGLGPLGAGTPLCPQPEPGRRRCHPVPEWWGGHT